MKNASILALLLLAIALPIGAEERHQSYISYDDGGTIIRSGDGREIEVHRNLPVYPEDEIITARRGRAEVRLSDGNIIGIDRSTALRLRSVLDSYEGDAEETVAELRYGKVAIYRTDLGRDHVRLDTDRASYVADYEAIYSVETDSRGSDRVTVFEGSVEVRTPARATRLRRGESASIDGRGIYDLVGTQSYLADDFEDWFLQRSERFDERSTRYVDRRLSYWTDDLDAYGSWVMASGIGWSWRPSVAVGWRPYYNGYWHRSRFGCLTWVSYDPWGWGPYHYGRWAYDPGYGWLWVPGYGYSPAWVYWWYGSGYVGWAPSGWWDCYRPYYDWAYRPYRQYGPDINLGFYGRIRVSEIDLRPWTFVDPAGLISNRVDRAALTADAVKHRLGRSGGDLATIAGGANRFTNEDMRDPAEAVRRRALDGREGRLTGRETGEPPTDLTPFFRRDEKVAGAVRDRVVRAAGGSGATPAVTRRGGGTTGLGGGTSGAGLPAPSTSGIDRRREGTRPRGSLNRGSDGGAAGGSVNRGRSGGGEGSVDRGGSATAPSTPPSESGGRIRAIDREPAGSGSSSESTQPRTSWRGAIRDRETTTGRTVPPALTTPPDAGSSGSSWRGRSGGAPEAPAPRSSDSVERRGTESTRGGSDVPRRVIDRIGGARVYPRDSDGGSGASGRSRSAPSDGPRAPRVQSGSSGGSRSSSGSSTSSGGSRSSGGSSTSSGSSSGRSGGGSQSGGSERSSGGRIKRD